MKVLDRKLLRECLQLRGQIISIAAVVACGIMSVVLMRGTYESLVISKDSYYRDYLLADVWAGLKRAPETVRPRIERLPGVARVETRVTLQALLDIEGRDEPARGLLKSLPRPGREALNRLHLTRGRYVAPGTRDEAIISEGFAEANGFEPGDTLDAIINGRLRTLSIVGVAISPEHVYEVPPGALYPEHERYGIVWMSRAVLGPAYDMDGAFNEVTLTLAPGADEREVIARLDRILERYGGLGAYGRENQPSYEIIEDELNGNRTTGTVMPAVFLAVAAFLLHIVLGRLIATQRTEIAVLKAFGYSNRQVGLHFLGFAAVSVALGAAVGSGAGIWLGNGMVNLYGDFFRFPVLEYHVRWPLFAIGFGVSALAAAIGAWGAVQRAVRLPPAEAMRPEPPARFKPGWIERFGLGAGLSASARMILRNVERQRARSGLSAIGVAFSVAILVIGLFMFDGVRFMMDLTFREIQREDLTILFHEPRGASIEYELARLDGVLRTEPFRVVPVRFRSRHLEHEGAITGVAAGTKLRRIVTTRGREHPLPPEGVLLSEALADKLRVRSGDLVHIEALEGERRTGLVPVSGTVDEPMGLSAYMDLDALTAFVRGGNVISGAYLRVAGDRVGALNQRLKELPVISGTASREAQFASFDERLAEGLLIGLTALLGFAGVIAVGVVYNGARISLSERGRELASLRVLGFRRREVAVLLLGEQGLITLVAIPIGWILGYVLSAFIATVMQSESYRIPLIITTRTYLWAALAVVVAAVLSGLLVRRRLDRMDLVTVLKTRE